MYKQREDDEKMKHKKLFAILTLVCFMFTLMPVAAMADEPMNFTDVSPSDWYYTVVKFAYENGLMGGTGENTFDPDATLSRGTLMTVLHRMEGSPAAAGEGFSDVADGEWYVEEPREIPILDRIGGGDGFVGGLLYAILKGWEPEKWIKFGWASGALAASSLNDWAEPADEKQLWSIYEGNARVQR